MQVFFDLRLQRLLHVPIASEMLLEVGYFPCAVPYEVLVTVAGFIQIHPRFLGIEALPPHWCRHRNPFSFIPCCTLLDTMSLCKPVTFRMLSWNSAGPMTLEKDPWSILRTWSRAWLLPPRRPTARCHREVVTSKCWASRLQRAICSLWPGTFWMKRLHCMNCRHPCFLLGWPSAPLGRVAHAINHPWRNLIHLARPW